MRLGPDIRKMGLSAMQDPQTIKDAFRAMQERQRSITWQIFLLFGVVLAANYYLPRPVNKIAGVMGLIGIAISIIRSFSNWRCPACGKYLGRNAEISACPHCDTEF